MLGCGDSSLAIEEHTRAAEKAMQVQERAFLSISGQLLRDVLMWSADGGGAQPSPAPGSEAAQSTVKDDVETPAPGSETAKN